MLNIKAWVKINPIQVKTPNGSQTVDKLYFNGFEDSFKLRFIRLDGEEYTLTCTDNHPLLTIDGRWVEAAKLTIGEVFNEGWILSNIEYVGKQPTYDIEVPNEHCYLLESGIVSHNTALILGGISEGINPDPAFTYTQQTPAGEVNRVNPVLLKIMKDRNVYDEEHIQELIDNSGSVQKVDWLTSEEKEVFKTAFEINQKDIVRLAAARQKYIDQGQSLNLFFSSEESEGYISEVHKEAFLSEDILSLYYCYSKAGVQASKGECSVCQ